MVDFVPELHALLDGIAPVYPADVKTSTAAIPCITWEIADDSDNMVGRTLQYSRLSVCLRVWADSKADLFRLSDAVDETMKRGGWRRENCGGDLHAGGRSCRVMTFGATGRETKKLKES